jgi:hypothetical protein
LQPSEAWNLDLVELIHLSDQENKQGVDLSVMLNAERMINGASQEWLKGVGNG